MAVLIARKPALGVKRPEMHHLAIDKFSTAPTPAPRTGANGGDVNRKRHAR